MAVACGTAAAEVLAASPAPTLLARRLGVSALASAAPGTASTSPRVARFPSPLAELPKYYGGGGAIFTKRRRFAAVRSWAVFLPFRSFASAPSTSSCAHAPSRPGVPWPDERIWICRSLRDGSASILRQPPSNSSAEQDDYAALDVYTRRLPGTKQVDIGGQRFFVFLAPRLGANHFAIWRRVADIRAWAASSPGLHPHSPLEAVAASVGELGGPVRISAASDRPQLTAPVYRWDELEEKDPNRYWHDGLGGGPWMYWDSFWAPSEPAAFASDEPAFGDVEGRMLAPMLGASSVPRHSSSEGQVRQASRSALLQAPNVVSSTAVGPSSKDRAYAIVYQFNVWGSEVSRSGTGSDLWSPEARLAVTALEAVVDHFGVHSVIDCACGDGTWIVPFFVARHPEVAYLGLEIVPEVVEANRRRFPGVDFAALDLAEAPLPSGAELVFSKETLNHMPLEDALHAMERFRSSGARYLLTNVHHGADNKEGLGKTCYTTYAKYDYGSEPFGLRRIASIVEYQGPTTSYSVYEL